MVTGWYELLFSFTTWSNSCGNIRRILYIDFFINNLYSRFEYLFSQGVTLDKISYYEARRHVERKMKRSDSLSVSVYKATLWNIFMMHHIKEGCVAEVLSSMWFRKPERVLNICGTYVFFCV
jgi:hypothetical protein